MELKNISCDCETTSLSIQTYISEMDSNKNLVQLLKSLLASKTTIFHHKHHKHPSDQAHQRPSINSDNIYAQNILPLTQENISLPSCIQKLPMECKLAIFSHLSASDKVRCQRVCTEWKSLVRSRCLWKKIDFSEVICSLKESDECASDVVKKHTNSEMKMKLEAYYEKEKIRVLGYFSFLSELRPSPCELKVCLDIGDLQDHWMSTIKSFMQCTNTSKLTRASINWKETPWKPYNDSFYTWSNNNYSDLIYKHRRRQRQFVPFFDHFTAHASNLEYLNLPFDWSAASVNHLCRLKDTLKELVLTEYFVPQSFDQSLLDKILSTLTKLEKLTINIVFGSGLGLVGYQFNSPSLKYLNLSKCKGIAVSKVDMPRLEVLIAGNNTFLSHYLAGSDDNLIRREPPLRLCHSLSSPPSLNSSSSSSVPLQRQRLQSSPLSSSLPEPSFLIEDPYHLSSLQKPLLLNSKTSESEDKTTTNFSEVFLNTSSLPCLIGVLKNGAPNLKRLNHFHFPGKRWPSYIDSSLHKALLETCFCKLHSSRTLSKVISS